MEATAWTVVGATVAILIAIGTSFRSLREEMRAQYNELRGRIDAQGKETAERIDAQGKELRGRIDAQGKETGERIDAQGKETGEQISQLRERMAHLEGLLEGLREAITGKRVA